MPQLASRLRRLPNRPLVCTCIGNTSGFSIKAPVTVTTVGVPRVPSVHGIPDPLHAFLPLPPRFVTCSALDVVVNNLAAAILLAVMAVAGAKGKFARLDLVPIVVTVIEKLLLLPPSTPLVSVLARSHHVFAHCGGGCRTSDLKLILVSDTGIRYLFYNDQTFLCLFARRCCFEVTTLLSRLGIKCAIETFLLGK